MADFGGDLSGFRNEVRDWLQANYPAELREPGAKTDPEAVKVLLNELIWGLRDVARWISPFMPGTAADHNRNLVFSSFFVRKSVKSANPFKIAAIRGQIARQHLFHNVLSVIDDLFHRV